jgi:O-antigen ligase
MTGDYNQTFWGLATVKRDQVLTNVWQSRLNGPVYDPNFFGQLLVAVVPLAIYRVIAERHWGLKLAGLAAALLITFVNFNTYSRGSFVALVLILLFIALERRVNLIWISLVLLISFAAMPFLPEGYTERLETLSMFGSEGSASVYKESSFRGRSSEILSGWHMFLDHPLLGVGAGNYEDHYQEYARGLGLETRTTDRQAHSLYVEIAAETGTIGLMAFSSIFLALFVGMARARRLARKWLLHDYPGWPLWMMAVQMSIIAYLLAGIFLHGDFLRTLWFLVALGVSAIHITDNLTKQYTQQPALNTTASST